MLLIYTPEITNRIKYSLKLVFTDVLGAEIGLTSDIEQFKSSEAPKISYSNQPVGDELFFYRDHFLLETGLKDTQPAVFDWNGTKVFFNAGENSALPFDPFAASFYLVSRYEEYLPHKRDHYDRYEAKESMAFKHRFLQRPVVNIWANAIKELVIQNYPAFGFPEKKYEFIPTIDIDNAYAYREKGLMRTLGGYAKSLLWFNLKELKQRSRVIFGREKDPYDTYDYQLELQRKYKLKPIYFMLVADYGLNDKNLPVNNVKFQSLIKMIADYAEVGIHPSFGSNRDHETLKMEISRLSAIIHRDIRKSRQHFLKLNLPRTYRNLLDYDITDDYTMGYASELGFRAGICSPFYFYDIDLETETRLRVHPFQVMEATLKFYRNVSPHQAINHIKPVIDEVRAVNGTFMSLWHNESLGDDQLWTGWKEVYEEMIELAMP